MFSTVMCLLACGRETPSATWPARGSWAARSSQGCAPSRPGRVGSPLAASFPTTQPSPRPWPPRHAWPAAACRRPNPGATWWPSGWTPACKAWRSTPRCAGYTATPAAIVLGIPPDGFYPGQATPGHHGTSELRARRCRPGGLRHRPRAAPSGRHPAPHLGLRDDAGAQPPLVRRVRPVPVAAQLAAARDFARYVARAQPHEHMSDWNISILLRHTVLASEQKSSHGSGGVAEGSRRPLGIDRWPLYADHELSGLCRSLTLPIRLSITFPSSFTWERCQLKARRSSTWFLDCLRFSDPPGSSDLASCARSLPVPSPHPCRTAR